MSFQAFEKGSKNFDREIRQYRIALHFAEQHIKNRLDFFFVGYTCQRGIRIYIFLLLFRVFIIGFRLFYLNCIVVV